MNAVYECVAGTSIATPHVGGAFAAIRSACPKATVGQILTALKKTGKPIKDTRPGDTQTKPRIQVDLALKRLRGDIDRIAARGDRELCED
jgi:serine protease